MQGDSKAGKLNLNIFFHMIILLIITFAMLFVFGVTYNNGDEYAIRFSMAGGYGNGIQRVAYVTLGPVFCLIEAILSFFIRDGYVYVYTMVSLAIIAATNFYLGLKNISAEWFCYIVNYAIFVYSLININHSLITIVLSFSGLFLVYSMAVKETKQPKGMWVLAIISIMTAASLRYALCAFSLLYLACFMIPNTNIRSVRKILLAGIVIFGFVGINCIVRMAIGHYTKIANDYMEWNSQSVGFRDFPDVDFDRYKELFEAVGWSRNDVDMLNHWCFDDLSVFTTEKMKYVLDRIPLNQHYNLNLRYIIISVLNERIVWIAVFLLLLSIVCTIRRRNILNIKQILNLLCIFSPFAIVMLGLAVRQRIYAHIYMPFFMLLLFELSVFLNGNNRIRYLLGIIIAVLVVYFGVEDFTSMQNKASRSGLYSEYVMAHADQAFFIDNSAIDYLQESVAPIVKKSRYELMPNLIPMADFDTSSPRDFIKLQNAGIKDALRPYTCLLDDDVYYIGREDGQQIEYLETYFSEHFGLDVAPEIVHDFGLESNVKVYKFINCNE